MAASSTFGVLPPKSSVLATLPSPKAKVGAPTPATKSALNVSVFGVKGSSGVPKKAKDVKKTAMDVKKTAKDVKKTAKDVKKTVKGDQSKKSTASSIADGGLSVLSVISPLSSGRGEEGGSVHEGGTSLAARKRKKKVLIYTCVGFSILIILAFIGLTIGLVLRNSKEQTTTTLATTKAVVKTATRSSFKMDRNLMDAVCKSEFGACAYFKLKYVYSCDAQAPCGNSAVDFTVSSVTSGKSTSHRVVATAKNPNWWVTVPDFAPCLDLKDRPSLCYNHRCEKSREEWKPELERYDALAKVDGRFLEIFVDSPQQCLVNYDSISKNFSGIDKMAKGRCEIKPCSPYVFAKRVCEPPKFDGIPCFNYTEGSNPLPFFHYPFAMAKVCPNCPTSVDKGAPLSCDSDIQKSGEACYFTDQQSQFQRCCLGNQEMKESKKFDSIGRCFAGTCLPIKN